MIDKESKHEKFKRLATQRTNEVLYRLRILENCSNTKLYGYNDEDIKKIFKTIDNEVKRVRTKFNNNNRIKFIL